MTVIEMAREAGIRDCTCNGTLGCLERFAELVRADERARMAEQPAPVQQEPVAWMHTNAIGHVYFRKNPQDKTLNPVPLYTSPPEQQQDFSDAYQGAREDLAIWKKRALAAEELNRKFIAGINGQTFMGEPAQEPVAWNVIDPLGKVVATETNAVRGWARIDGYKPTVEGLLGFHEQGWRVVPAAPQPPAQREWVRLTDEEIDAAWPSPKGTNSVRMVARIIEAKLKEKNT